MSKKLITVLLTVLTVMLLTGCNADKKAVTQTAEGFLNAMVNNDREAASQYATEEFMKSKTMKLMEPDYLADTFYASMGLEKEDVDEEAQKAVDEYVRKVISKAYKSYEIEEMKVQEETATVTAKITLGYDPEASSKQSDDTLDLISQYQTEHYDELMEIYKNEGKNEMYKKLYNDLIPIIIGKMQEELESSEPSEEKTVLSLAKIDKKWLVTGLEENRPKAADAGTAEEAAAAVSTAGESENADADRTSDEYAAEGLTENEYAQDGATSSEAAEEEADPDEGSTAGNTADSGNTSEKAAEADTTEGETGN